MRIMNMFRFDKQRHFSTYLMTSIVLLVTGSVILISGLLYLYYGKRLESEFNKKILAQRGQIEILLKNRIAEVQSRLKDFSSNNMIRFAMEMGDDTQLEEQLRQFYPGNESVFFFIYKEDEGSLYPKNPHGPWESIQGFILTGRTFPHPCIEDGDKTRFLWCFSTPILHQEDSMGTAYTLYDMAKDSELKGAIQQAVEGDLLGTNGSDLLSLMNGSVYRVDTDNLGGRSWETEFLQLGPDLALSGLAGFEGLFFSFSPENLQRDKNRIAILLGLFSVLVLTVSAGASVFLGRKIARPLAEMATKAIQISVGEKDLWFEEKEQGYVEFRQLSEAFNSMLTNLKDMEEKTRFIELLENVDDAVYIVDREGKIVEANEATYVQLGYTPKDFFRLDLRAILPEKDASMVLEPLRRDPPNQHPAKMTFETEHIKRDGDPTPVEIKSRSIYYLGQKVILNVARDIQERRQAEKELRESEERYRSVVESSHDGILILDDKRKIIYANHELCQILGYSRAEIDGNDFAMYLDEQSVPYLHDLLLKRSGEDPKSMTQYELSFLRKDGKKRHGKISTTTLMDSAGQENTVVQILDITEQLHAENQKRQLETQLQHAQRMEAVGTLAGGVAHDFNNLLQIIQGFTELLLLKKRKNNPDVQKLEEVKHAAQMAGEITKKLLAFSRKVETNMEPLDVNREVTQLRKLLRASIPQMVEIELHLADNLKRIHADPVQLGQIIMNLSMNARDAMPEGGKLVIETENATLDTNDCTTHIGATPGDYVVISVSDTGEGMDTEMLEHVFEPFFTTKDPGRGTGLGLAIVYGIVKNHGGYIICYSEPGEGTTFKIYLPGLEQEASPVSETEQRKEQGGTETILLVDDDDQVRSIGQEMLSNAGYSVLTAPNGESCLELYRTQWKEIHLVILDLIMPGMGGKQCLQKLLEIAPEANVLIASGHSAKGSAKHALDAGANGFIGKPYKLQRMLHSVREVLDGKEHRG